MKREKRFVSLMLALVMICSLMVNAGAAETQEEISAYLNYDITVRYNGEVQELKDAGGNTVYPVSYNGTTYVPVRAVSNILGITVDWEQATQTVLLSDPTDSAAPAAESTSDTADTLSGQKAITAQINRSITVKYNGEVQTLKDAGGNTVYPVSYNGTTYLPIRAVSSMLGVKVDWVQGTQTILLSDSTGDSNEPEWLPEEDDDIEDNETLTVSAKNSVDVIGLVEGRGNVVIDRDNPEASRDDLKKAGYSDEEIEKLIWRCKDVFFGAQTTEGAEVLGENHIGIKWFDVDWSTAVDGYARVNVNKLPDGPATRVSARVRWDDNGTCRYGTSYTLTEGEWNLPLPGGDTEYVIQINLSFLACEHNLNKAEKAAWDDENNILIARFNAEITNPDNLLLLSTPDIDFEHAPLTRAKALEITKGCTTDAEKIAAVFNWVSKNIKYDHEEFNRGVAAKIKAKASTEREITCLEDPVNGMHIVAPDPKTYSYQNQNVLDLDQILAKKTGVCAHYAILMTGMLRSLGIPCQYVTGSAYNGVIIKDYSDDGWGPHAWVAVKPNTGTLNRAALGAGTDYSDPAIGKRAEPTGWTRLDPTWGATKEAANDSNYRPYKHN